MNYMMVRRILGYVAAVMGISIFLPLFVAVFSGETREALSFLITMAACGLAAFLLMLGKPKKKEFYAKESFVIVSFSWIMMSLLGALPYFISGAIPSFLNCLYESVSGFTTTGSSILAAVESLPSSILIWRSFSHWIGGMGVLIFLLSIVSMAGGNSVYLLKTESSAPESSRLVPRIKQTAKMLYLIYLSLTVLLTGLLLLGGMSFFESVNHAMSIAGTGGFSVKDASISVYSSSYIHWIIVAFMIIFSVNFNFYHLLLLKKFKAALKQEEVIVFLCILAGGFLLVALNIHGVVSDSLGDTARLAAFQVASVASSTGLYSVDYGTWPQFSIIIFTVLMFIGGCSHSTAGGTRVMRTIILSKSLRRETRKLLHPKIVEQLQINGKPAEENLIKSVYLFFAAYFALFIVSLLLVSLENYDFQTTFSAVISSLSNIGPGFSLAGPVGNYDFFSPLSKSVLMFDMIAGRLGIFPLLMIFIPSVWSRRKNAR